MGISIEESPIFKNNNTATHAEELTLYERLGGESVLAAAIEEFYERLVADEELTRFFSKKTLPILKMHQRSFMKIVSTRVPQDLDVPKLILDKHRRLIDEEGLNETHFDLVAGHLAATLQHFEVQQNLIDEVGSIIGPLRSVFENKTTLYARIGGEAALTAAVEEFYQRLVSDEELAKFFDDISLPRLKMHQRNFLRVAFTHIPNDMDVFKLIADRHKKLMEDKGLNEVHFDLVAGHLVATLQHLEVPQHMIDEVVGIVGPLRMVFEQKDA